MHIIRKIVQGVDHWLNFEVFCRREKLFSESYITYPIGQILGARFGRDLEIEIEHPVLAPLKRGARGDKPRIDFAVRDESGALKIVIETKWASKSGTLIRDIIRDLVRLELVNHHCNATAVLIFAGETEMIKQLMDNPKFQGHPLNLGSRPILPYDKSESGSLRLNPPAKFRKKLLSQALELYKDVDLINSIRVTKFGSNFSERRESKYSVIAWRIDSKNPGRF